MLECAEMQVEVQEESYFNTMQLIVNSVLSFRNMLKRQMVFYIHPQGIVVNKKIVLIAILSLCFHTIWHGLEAVGISRSNDNSNSSNSNTNPNYSDEVAVFDNDEIVKIKLKDGRILYISPKVAEQTNYFSGDSWKRMQEGSEKLFGPFDTSFEDVVVIETFKLLRIPNVFSMMKCLDSEYDDNAIAAIFDFAKYIGADYLCAACVSIIENDLVGNLISIIGMNSINEIKSLVVTLAQDNSISLCATVNVCISNGYTPLLADVASWAALTMNDDLELCRFLLDSGANPNACNYAGNTSLHYAAKHGNQELASLLLKYDANINSYNDDGQAPIHVAKEKFKVDMFEFFLANDAEINFGHEPLSKPLSNLQTNMRKSTVNSLMKAQTNLRN
jgi:hypothetical protein